MFASNDVMMNDDMKYFKWHYCI